MQACNYNFKHKSNSNLREVQLDILDPNVCAKTRELDTKRELCVGKVWRKPVVGLFIQVNKTGTYEMINKTSGRAKYNFVGYHVRRIAFAKVLERSELLLLFRTLARATAAAHTTCTTRTTPAVVGRWWWAW